MNNVTKKTKIILFAVLLVAMILQISNLEMIDASSEKADKKDDSKKKEKKSKDKDEKKKENKSKVKEYNYEIKSNYVEKDLHNYEADKVLQKMQSFLMIMPDSNNTTSSSNGPMASTMMNIPQALSAPLDMVEMDKLQKELEKVTKDHKDKIIDKDLRKDLKKARQLIIDSGIPTNVLGTGIDHLYIQLSEKNAKYEELIIKLLKDVPYKIEYGEGIKRSACLSTSSDCDYEIGGVKIQIKTSLIPFSEGVCSLSIPMNKDGIPGFLTAAHCFNGYSENVYQPDTTSESNIIGYSNSTWRSFVDDGECDCAWIKDTSSVEQRAGVYAIPNYYWAITSTHVPALGENAMLRGFHNNNGEFYFSDPIEYDDISISDWWGFGKTTVNMMAFAAPAQGGDSGGSIFYGNSYIGIAVAKMPMNGTMYTVFVPWDHITQNISGLSLTPHP